MKIEIFQIKFAIAAGALATATVIAASKTPSLKNGSNINISEAQTPNSAQIDSNVLIGCYAAMQNEIERADLSSGEAIDHFTERFNRLAEIRNYFAVNSMTSPRVSEDVENNKIMETSQCLNIHAHLTAGI